MKERIILFMAIITFIVYFSFTFNKSNAITEDPDTNAPHVETSSLLPDEQNNIAVYKATAPSVVNVSCIKTTQTFFGATDEPSGGSGFIWDKTGHVVTNYHVIQDTSKIFISLHNDSKQYEAEIVGVAPRKDIAVLKLKNYQGQLVPIKAGYSSNLMVGQKAIALGNPFGLDHTFTTGIISALNRKIQGIGGVEIHGIIQTDASINPGNSGGPLLNSKGEFIGMNTAIISKSGSSSGLGFAVPAQTIKRIVPQLIEYQKEIRPTIGVVLEPRVNLKQGIAIKFVHQNAPAHKSGLRGMSRDRYGRLYLGDVIIAINKININSINDLYHTLGKYKIGDEVELSVINNRKTRTLKIKLTSN